MEEMFGEGCWRHTVILFTNDDSLKEQSIEEFLQAGSQDLQQLVEKCGSRYHVLNIKDRSHDTPVPELLEKIEKMVSGNRESFYCSQTYQETEAQVREMERKIQKEMEERKQRVETEIKERLDKELQESLKKIEGGIQEHEGDIRTLNHKTTELERQVKEEKDEEKKREMEREIKNESDRRKEMERKLERLKEKRENEKKEMDEKHKQEIEEIKEKYEEEARVEAERNLMKIVLPELQRNIMNSQTKMKTEFSRQMEEKDREMEEKDGEIERLRQNLKEVSEAHSVLEEKDRQIEEKDRQIEEKDRQIEEKDEQIKNYAMIWFLVFILLSLFFAVQYHWSFF
uniref:AIG1-type G domain-containing protein n=1 Tax=Esox lucius TaxID=8010 RepID=A0AAY5L7T0_ESOLU